MKPNELLAGAAKAATYNMALQLSIRVMTFLLNAVMLRYITTDMLGVVNVRLTLLYTTTLFISTEAFDQACLSKLQNKNWTQVVNLMWCTFPLSIIMCCVFSFIWMYLLEAPDDSKVPYYNFGVVMYAVSTVITTLARPQFIVGQAHVFVKLRVLSVALSELAKCIVAAVLVIFVPRLGLINFSIAQLVCGVVYTGLYYATFYRYVQDPNRSSDFVFRSSRDFFPQRIPDQPMIDSRLASLTGSFFKQSILKQILTEGEKYIMTIFGVLNFGDQGVYDTINNLGSMAPRFVFLPIEESGRLFFSSSLLRGQSLSQQTKESIELTTKVLQYLLKFVTLIGLIILVFGQAYAYLALDLYGGNVLSSGSGPMLLRWYTLYVLIIAVNGTTECYYFAIMSKQEIDKYNQKMLLFSAVLLASSLHFTKQFGSVGFILANCINMGTRIAHSTYFIYKYYRGSPYQPLRGLIPPLPVLGSLAVSYLITTVSEIFLCCHHGIIFRLLHITIGGVCLLVVMVTIFLTEKDLLQFVKTQYELRQGVKQE